MFLVGLSPGLFAEPCEPVCRELKRFAAVEAHQGVAVDATHFYAIGSRTLGKYNKGTGQRVTSWNAPKGSEILHLNSAIVKDGKLYCAHSNWPKSPLKNSLEIWSTNTLKPIDRKVFTEKEGALTWVDWREGHWWGLFAFYGEAETVRKTTLVKWNDRWERQATWTFPEKVIQRFVPYSCSGGSWGPNGLLYVTGHDRGEMYALRLPVRGTELEWSATLPAPIEGQAIAWDHSDLGVVYGIQRSKKSVVVSRLSHTREYDSLKYPTTWKRDSANPVLPPLADHKSESTRCMNPWVLRRGTEYQLYYSGGDSSGKQQICLSTANIADPTNWKRQGPLFPTGKAGAFDARWCVLPHVVPFGDGRWHLYYTGNAGRGSGLSAFPGIGLAVSDEGKTWRRHSQNPVLKPSGEPGTPDAIGMAGGSVISVKSANGQTEWRFYYTGCPTVGKALPLNQQKTICLAVSSDGIHWKKRGAVMYRDPTRDYENIGVAGPVVRRHEDGTFRMWYSAIGTRWGYYSICYAESDDGLSWRRGKQSGDNLQLTPQGDGWERQMVEYPSIIKEGDHLRMFYCGNGYGRTGIGTAVSVSKDDR